MMAVRLPFAALPLPLPQGEGEFLPHRFAALPRLG
jgi:hypothetical protein